MYKKLFKIILTSKVELLCSPLRDIVKLVLLWLGCKTIPIIEYLSDIAIVLMTALSS